MQASTDYNRNGIPDQLEGRSGLTDLNRNGVPDQLEGQGFGFVGSVAPVTSSTVSVTERPAIVQIVEKPAVVHEVYKTEEVVQIQPVIEREREQLDVYEVVQPLKEREVIATEVREAVLPAQTRSTIVQDNSAFLAARSAPSDFSTREVAPTRTQVIQNAPIIHETVNHRVVEEVQPVIYKEVDRPVLVKETLPIQEKIIEAPRAHHTVLPVRDLGVRSQGFTDVNRDGIPDQLQTRTSSFQAQPLQQSGSFGTTDLNRNGIPDQLEGNQRFGTVQYVQTNQLPAQQFVRPMPLHLPSQPYSQDLNRNGIPDQLEGGHAPRTLHDLNGNGIPDRLEKGHGLNDLNGNGIPDRMERPSALGNTSYPVGFVPSVDTYRHTTAIVNNQPNQFQQLAQSGPGTPMPQEFLNTYQNTAIPSVAYRENLVNPHPSVLSTSAKGVSEDEATLAQRLAQAVHVANVRRL